MSRAEIEERIASFPRWHYEIEFDGGVTTPIHNPINVNRHSQRRRYFVDALVALYGGSLQGKRVLDLGCNAGFWSLAMIEAGADHVLGVDGRAMHVDQANFVFEAKGIDRGRYDFLTADLFDLKAPLGQFDIVLCLGLLYHVSKPVELFDLMAATGAEVIVVDTEVDPSPAPIIRLRLEDTEEYRNAVDRSLVFVPTARAVHTLGEAAGFSMVTIDSSVIDDFGGMADYANRRRRAFLGSRGPALDHVASEPLPQQHPAGPAPRFRRLVRRALRRAWR